MKWISTGISGKRQCNLILHLHIWLYSEYLNLSIYSEIGLRNYEESKILIRIR